MGRRFRFQVSPVAGRVRLDSVPGGLPALRSDPVQLSHLATRLVRRPVDRTGRKSVSEVHRATGLRSRLRPEQRVLSELSGHWSKSHELQRRAAARAAASLSPTSSSVSRLSGMSSSDFSPSSCRRWTACSSTTPASLGLAGRRCTRSGRPASTSRRSAIRSGATASVSGSTCSTTRSCAGISRSRWTRPGIAGFGLGRFGRRFEVAGCWLLVRRDSNRHLRRDRQQQQPVPRKPDHPVILIACARSARWRLCSPPVQAAIAPTFRPLVPPRRRPPRGGPTRLCCACREAEERRASSASRTSTPPPGPERKRLRRSIACSRSMKKTDCSRRWTRADCHSGSTSAPAR